MKESRANNIMFCRCGGLVTVVVAIPSGQYPPSQTTTPAEVKASPKHLPLVPTPAWTPKQCHWSTISTSSLNGLSKGSEGGSVPDVATTPRRTKAGGLPWILATKTARPCRKTGPPVVVNYRVVQCDFRQETATDDAENDTKNKNVVLSRWRGRSNLLVPRFVVCIITVFIFIACLFRKVYAQRVPPSSRPC